MAGYLFTVFYYGTPFSPRATCGRAGWHSGVGRPSLSLADCLYCNFLASVAFVTTKYLNRDSPTSLLEFTQFQFHVMSKIPILSELISADGLPAYVLSLLMAVPLLPSLIAESSLSSLSYSSLKKGRAHGTIDSQPWTFFSTSGR